MVIYFLIHVLVSLGAQEIFKLLPHTFVDSSKLPRLFDKVMLALFIISLFLYVSV